MNLSAQFKAYLLSLGSSASKVTVKNYVADVNKFIKWFESKYSRSFSPSEISESTISAFKKDSLANYSASSVDRNISSLRKFFTFLKLEGQISHSPFDEKPKAEELKEADLWRVKDFKNYLYVFNASHLTIKNYIIDLKQFISWAEEVLKSESNYEVAESNILAQVDSSLINEYKNRLLNEAKLSPVSVNRKLSSLRRYFSWAEQEGIIKSNVQVLNESSVQEMNEDFGFIADQDISEANQQQAINSQSSYSSFPPIRLAQKISRAGIMVADGILILPLVALAHKAEYGIWALKGKPVIEAESAGLLAGVLRSQAQPLNKVKNVGKEFYAPAKVSLKYYPLHKKAIFHLKYTRPDWYKRYQNTSFVRFAQLAILAILFSALSYAAYSNLGPNKNQTKSFAALPTAPPRILSFQGRLTDTTDNPITSPTAIRMAIYDTAAASGSSLLWQEIVTVTPDSDGIFATLLGNNTTIPQSVFAENSALWLGVTVGQTAELTPRQQIATVAFATNSETLQGLEPITNSASTSNVVLALNSSGNLSIGGSANPVFQSTGGSFTVQGTTLILSTTAGSGGNVRIAPDGLGKIDLQKPLQNNTLTGNINTSRGAVEVDDLFAILATSSGQSAFTLNQDSTGPLISASTSGVAKFTVDNGGNLTAAGTINGLTVSNGTITSGTWNGTAISSTYGGTGINTSSSTGVPYISGGTWSVDANALAANHGGTSFTTYAQGDTIYASATNTLSKLTIGGNGTCLVSNGTVPSWGSCGTGTGTNWWTTSSDGKALTPINSTMDFLLGGQATTSAKFAITNLTAALSPIATLSATTASGGDGNGIVLNSSGSIQTLRNNTLNIGGNTTGNIIISPLNGGTGSTLTLSTVNQIWSGTTAVTASSLSSLTTAATLGMTSTTTLNLGNNATINSNATALNLQTDGSVDVNIAGGSGATGCTVQNSTGNLTCTGTITGAGAIGYWNRNSGNVFPSNTNDTISATSSASTVATFTSNNPAGTITNSTLIQHTGAGTRTNLLNLTQSTGSVTNGLTFSGTFTNLINSTNFSVSNAGAISAATSTNTINNLIINSGALSGITGYTQASGAFAFSGGGNFSVDSSAFDVTSGGAVSGVTTLNASSTITFSSFNANNNVLYATVSTGQLAGANTNSTGLCLLSGASAPSWSTCPGGSSSTNWWTTSSDGKALTPINSTMDFLLGGQATTSAKFSVLGLNSARGSQTASISGSVVLDSSTASFQTTMFQNLSIGGNTTGNVQVNNKSGTAFTTFDTTNSRVGIGTTAPSSPLSVSVPAVANTTIADFQNNGSSIFNVNNTNGLTLNAGGACNGSICNALNLNLTGAVNVTSETIPVKITSPSYTITGSYANQRIMQVTQPTITAGSALSISTEADTLNIAGAPISAGSVTIANSVALRIAAGTSIASGVTNGYGLYVDAPTGASNNYAAVFATGNVGIGDTSPTAALTVGSGDAFQVNSSGAIAATTGYTQASGAFAFSGGGNFSVDSAAFDVNTSGAVSGVTTLAASGVVTFSNAAYTGNNAVLYGTTSTGVLAAATTSTSGLCLVSGAASSYTPTWSSCPGGTNYWNRTAGNIFPATTNDTISATSSAYNPFTATTNNPAGTLTNNTLIQHIAAGTVTNLLTLSRTAGTVTTGLNLTGTIGTDISLQNGETISNNNDGTVAVTSPLTTLSGSARGVGDDTYFSWDYTTQRIGFTKKSGQTGKLTYGSANSFAIAQSNATDIAAANTFTDRFVIDSTGNISMGGVVTLANAAYTGNNAVIYGTVSTGQLAAATTSTSGQCLLSGAGAGFTPTWGTCPAGSSGTNWWTTSSDGKALTPINSTMDFLLGGQATTSAKFAFTGLSLANNQTQATLSGQLTVVPNNGYGGNASLAAQLTLGSFANPVIQTEKNQTLTIGGNKTGNINIAPLNGATGSNLTLTTINQTWTGTTTVTASSLTTLTTGATLAFSGDIRVNGNDILDSGGTSRITTGATTTLTNTTTTLSGTTTLTAASLATLTSSTTLSMNPNTGTTYTINTTGTTLNLFNTTAATFNFAGAATTFTLGGTTGTMSLRNPTINVANGGNAIIATTSNGNLTHTAAGTGQILLSADFNSGVQIATAVVSTPLAPLYINGGIGNNSAVIINQTNNGNILVASSAGTTRLTIDNTGNIDANSFITGSWTIDVNSPCNGSGRLCFSNGGTAEVSFTTGGQGRFTGGTVTDTPDYAENITVLDQSIESGDIVTSVIYDSTADSVYKKSTASKSIKAYQNEIIGGISENPGFLAAQGNSSSLPDDRPWTDSERPLTVAGRIPVKVTTQNGSINVGDRITSSDRPGIGMKATEAGQVVGIAMEPYSSPDPQEVKKILVFINPGFYDPDVVLTNSGDFNIAPTVDYNFEIQRNGENFTRIGGYSEIISAKIRGGFAEIQKISVQTITGVTGTFQNITTDTLAIATSNITIAGQSIQDFIASIVDQRIAQNQGEGNIISPLETDGDNVVIKLKTNDDKSKFVVKNASGSAVATIDGNGNASLSGQLNAAGASISGTLRADRIIANQIEGLNVQASTVSANYITNNYYISTPSGEVQNATPSGLFNQSATRSAMFGDLSAQTATFTQGLMSFGPSSFFEASIADRLFVGSQLSLADNSINVLGADLKIQPLRQGNVSFMAGLIKIDTDGNLNVGGNSYFAKDVEVKGKIAANIIAPLSGKDLVFQLNEDENNKVQFKNGTNSAFLSINNKGDINASGAGTFAKLNLDIVKEVQAVSDTEVIATGSAGLAEIKANREEVTINNKLVNEDSLIYITPKTAIPNNSVYLIRQVPGESFTVGISDTINKKVQFNWIIIN